MKSLSVILFNAWTGLCAVALAEQTHLLTGGSPEIGPLEGFVFGGALFAYNIIRRDPLPRFLAWAFGALGLVCLVQLPRYTQAAAVVPFVAWGLYYGALGFVTIRLRTIAHLKPATVSLVWAWVTVLLPLTSGQWLSAIILFMGRAAFLFALAFACDVCDAPLDAKHGLDTLAVRLRGKSSLRLIDAALALSAGCVTINWLLGNYPAIISATLIVTLILAAASLRLIFTARIGARLQKAAIDSIMLLQFLGVWIVTSL